jgi:Co/Zn/Cd efflux system component
MGLAMMAYSSISFAVNLYVLLRLAPFQHGEVHMRASYLVTRVDVIANLAVFISGVVVAATGLRVMDLLVGLGIGLYVLKEAFEVVSQASARGCAT